jgi:hypothetical protein
VVEGAGEMALVEEGYDFVCGVSGQCIQGRWGRRTSSLEACDVLADGFDGAGTVRARDDGLFGREGVFAMGNDEVTVVEGSGVHYHCVRMDSITRQWQSGNIPLTRTSLSPISGMEALSSNLRASKPPLLIVVHCFVVEGAMMCGLLCVF